MPTSSKGVRAHARCGRALGLAVVFALGIGSGVTGLAPSARAFDFFDGKLQIHGYVEQQVRGMGEDFDFGKGFDLAQWYNVLALEIEYDIAPDGWGPFDLVSSFMRVEARYDCVWTRACGLFPSANAFGDRVRRLPDYKTDGRRSGFSGSVSIRDQLNAFGLQPEIQRFTGVRYVPFNDPRTNDLDAAITSKLALDCDPADGTRSLGDLDQPHTRCRSVYARSNERKPARIDQIDGFTGLFAIAGANQQFEASGDVETISVPNPRFGAATDGSDLETIFATINDDPAFFYFSGQTRCKFGQRFVPGGSNGIANQIIGPIDPRCRIEPAGALINKPNPFNALDLNPLLVNPRTGERLGGSGELPGRPASQRLWTQNGGKTDPRGVWYPSGRYRQWLRDGKDSIFDQNFSESELAWNRGGSQQDEKEIKEVYLDMEFFDSRLWIRAGKQNIVWGKTELFRTTDQFNPQDLALASLPSLEESRIGLWSIRGVWSFYQVGPLDDLRLELAMNIDDFEPADIGRCGEPFTALVACNKTTGLWAHGLFGVGLAGEHRPPVFWNGTSGLEYGARLEWRAGRFSFQISDFYGYEDFPYVRRLNIYERNIDPLSGRPRSAGSRERCIDGNEAACLPMQSNLSFGPADPKSSDPLANSGALAPTIDSNPLRRAVTDAHSSNIQIFAAICATSIGFNSVDPTACGQSVFNSKTNVFGFIVGDLVPPRVDESERKVQQSISALLSNTLAGNTSAASLVRLGFTATSFAPPYVPLNADPCDAFLSDNRGGCTDIPGRGPTAVFGSRTLNSLLTDEQEALLGCGAFWGTDCEADGMDLLNAEASVLMQSFIGFEGAYAGNRNLNPGWSYGATLPDGVTPAPQPGTDGFFGGPVALRNERGQIIQLPGSRGPSHPQYNPLVDGSIAIAGPAPWACDGATALSIPCRDVTGVAFPDGGFGASGGLPFTSEMAALSFNLQTTLVAFSAPSSVMIANQRAGIGSVDQSEFNPDDPFSRVPGQCSYNQPQYCSSVKSFFSITGVQRNSIRAGGNGSYGRRDFQWHGGGEGVLEYQKRNVLGFSLDFAEDFTKSNWGVETTWISNVRFTDNNNLSGLNTGDTFNMTISVDRPTFINFLNPNRTFFFNSQVFFQYINNYQSGFVNNGPFNMLGTFTVQTGYFQDRLLPSITFVYDVNSNSGAALPQVTYRFTESFSASVGFNVFFGRWEYEDMAITPLGTLGAEVGRLAYRDGVENGLSVVRERDEAFFRLRYTF